MRHALLATASLALIACGVRRTDEPLIERSPAVPEATSASTAEAASTGAAGGTGASVTDGAASAGSGGATGAGGEAGAGGGGGATGSGGDGGGLPAPIPVPGCEELAWVGDPLEIESGYLGGPRLVGLEGGDVGLVYVHYPQLSERVVRAAVLEDPFVTWPPATTPWIDLIAFTNDLGHQLEVIGRSDGVFTFMAQWPTRAARFGSGPTGLAYDGHIVPVAESGGGAYALSLGADVHWLPDLDEGTAPVLVGTRPSARCYRPGTVPLPGGELLVSDGPYPSCAADTVEIMRVSTSGAELLASHPALGAREHQLVARPGGAWLAIHRLHVMEVTPLDEGGAADGPTWIGDAWNRTVVAPWGDGFMLAQFRGMPGASGVELRVSDGVHSTFLAAPEGEAWGSETGISLVASADGRTILVAHDQFIGRRVVQVRRAACVSR